MYGDIPWTLAKKKDRVLYGPTDYRLAWLRIGSPTVPSMTSCLPDTNARCF